MCCDYAYGLGFTGENRLRRPKYEGVTPIAVTLIEKMQVKAR